MLRYSDAWLDTKPYKEIYDGRVHHKVSPQLTHFILHGRIGSLLSAWVQDRGVSGPELRVFLDDRTSLVPDLAFISYERLASLSPRQREKPPFAPELVVEIRSPGQWMPKIRRKTELYLAHGAVVVLNVDPKKRTILVTTSDQTVKLGAGETFEHPAFPDLRLSVDAVFAPLDRWREPSPG
jgi:Uma2 family endonuclease